MGGVQIAVQPFRGLFQKRVEPFSKLSQDRHRAVVGQCGEDGGGDGRLGAQVEPIGCIDAAVSEGEGAQLVEQQGSGLGQRRGRQAGQRFERRAAVAGLAVGGQLLQRQACLFEEAPLWLVQCLGSVVQRVDQLLVGVDKGHLCQQGAGGGQPCRLCRGLVRLLGSQLLLAAWGGGIALVFCGHQSAPGVRCTAHPIAVYSSGVTPYSVRSVCSGQRRKRWALAGVAACCSQKSAFCRPIALAS